MKATSTGCHKLGESLGLNPILPVGTREEKDLKVASHLASQNPGWASVQCLKYLCFVTALRPPQRGQSSAMHYTWLAFLFNIRQN